MTIIIHGERIFWLLFFMVFVAAPIVGWIAWRSECKS